MAFRFVVAHSRQNAVARSGDRCPGALCQNAQRHTEIVTAPIPAQSPFIPVDARIVVGAVAPAAADPIPIVLLPGYEYRMREWRHPDTHEMHWRLERRKSAQLAENDE